MIDGTQRAGFGRADLFVLLASAASVVWLLLSGAVHDLVGVGTRNGAPPPDQSAAWRQLAALEVVPNGPSLDAPPYDRDHFGKGWGDLDGDGCNTRNEILARDLGQTAYEEGTNGCVVTGGILAEPYTGEVVRFVKGKETSMDVQIDHVVALGDAWQAGAWKWDDASRHRFSNDPFNLLAVDGHQNYLKSALTADQWLPPDETFHCEFISRQVAVKHKWNLTVTEAEAQTMKSVLTGCPDVQLE